MSLHKILSDSVTVLCLISSAIGIFKFKALSKELKMIFYFVLLGAFTELFTDFYKAFIAQKTGPIAHFYTTSSILILIVFYRKVLAGFIKPWILDALIILFLSYEIVNLIFIQNLYDFPSLLGAIGALIIVIFSILLFARIMLEAKIKSLRKEPLIWINVGLLFYYSGNFFYFIMFNLNVENAYEFARQVGTFVAFLNIAFYVLVAFSFILHLKSITRSKSY